MSSERQAVRLRRAYTGEPHQAAVAFYRRHGLRYGLVPDAADPQQVHFEAALLHALARPAAGQQHVPGAVFGLTGASPGVESLVLWPHPQHLTALLLHLLPSCAADGLTGVPGLRARTGPYRDLTVHLHGRAAHVTIRATGADVAHARAVTEEAGCEPLWDQAAAAVGERQAWDALVDSFAPGEAALWSRALRRVGLHRETSVLAWADRAPRQEELAGPKPMQLQPRPVGPPAGEVRGVVGVTAADGRGGTGTSTVALHLAGALAGGRRVGLLVGTDPNSPLTRQNPAGPPAPGQWQDLPTGQPGASSLSVAALPDDPSAARVLLARAREEHEVVVLDAGSGVQHRDLAGEADLVLAVTDHIGKRWVEVETIDRRPDHVQMWAWLERSFMEFPPDDERTPDAELLTLLDVEFAHWAVLREAFREGEEPAPEVEWGLVEELEELFADGLSPLPTEEEAPHLDRWREEFLARIDAEGTRRHPGLWPTVRTLWPEHNRGRNRAGLQPGEPGRYQLAALRERFLTEIEEEATALWGRTLWQQHRQEWADRPPEEDLFQPHEELLEHIARPRPPREVETYLLDGCAHLPVVPTLLTVNRVRQNISAAQLDDVREALRARGVAGLVTVPHLPELEQVTWEPQAVTQAESAFAASAGRLAVAVTDALGRDGDRSG
ncbi:hypothetical protein [Streptomyces nanshensis]|uniref:CobQ/CobB/MinD/ParA nucleotide binding domain-containing protein n=1 Tax=Streptomyces nanshensis TaxID=518642 RepID=A0A1E7L8N6_9ACTN|nr:hypothetical protein [Streptomyces nanshensis]OEV12585.1 hypothetical protein AN218_07630 [Streptomyces nanshensis]